MRLLHIVPSLEADTGGPARSVPALCHALQQRGVEVTLFHFNKTRTPALGFAQPFAPVRGTRQVPTRAYLRALAAALPTYDLVHLHSMWNLAVTLSARACARAATPFVLTPRGMLQSGSTGRRRLLKRLYALAFENRTLRTAATLHFLTETEAQESRPLTGDKPSFVIPNGINLEELPTVQRGAFRRAHPELAENPFILFIGRLHPGKGLDTQAAAFQQLAADFPDLLWVLAGQDDGEAGRLQARARSAGLSRRLVLTGLLPQAQCFEALADASAFVMTSRPGFEGQPLAAIEALAAGTPVVLTKSVGFLEPGRVGAAEVVENTPTAVAAAVAAILKDPRRASGLAQAGRAFARDHLAWPHIADELIREYDKILARHAQHSHVGRATS